MKQTEYYKKYRKIKKKGAKLFQKRRMRASIYKKEDLVQFVKAIILENIRDINEENKMKH